MALCAQGVVSLAGGGDPDCVRRLAVRFASPVYVGDELAVHLYRAGENRYVFDAEAAGEAVIRHGLAVLRRDRVCPHAPARAT